MADELIQGPSFGFVHSNTNFDKRWQRSHTWRAVLLSAESRKLIVLPRLRKKTRKIRKMSFFHQSPSAFICYKKCNSTLTIYYQRRKTNIPPPKKEPKPANYPKNWGCWVLSPAVLVIYHFQYPNFAPWKPGISGFFNHQFLCRYAMPYALCQPCFRYFLSCSVNTVCSIL